MKAGTFAQNNDSAGQLANKYDPLRTNRESDVVSLIAEGYDLTFLLVALAAQPTGWFPGSGAYGSF